MARKKAVRAKRPQVRAIRAAQTYTIGEAADTMQVSTGTIRNWVRAGLPVMKERRPYLFLGEDLKAFVQDRRNTRKVRLKPGEFYCFTCKDARRPMGMLADYHPVSAITGRLWGFARPAAGSAIALQVAPVWTAWRECSTSRSRTRGRPKGHFLPSLNLTLRKDLRMRRKLNTENERIKRAYLHYLREAKRRDPQTVNKAADDILRFEAHTGFKPFKLFHIEQAMAFKRHLQTTHSQTTGKPLSKATIDGTLRAVKSFIFWLAEQPGYKSRIKYSDAEYFNLNAKDARIAHTERDAPYPSMEQCRHAFGLMPDTTPLERRDKALFAFLMLTGIRDGALASLRLKHIDLTQGTVHQDAREVRTKFAKTFTTTFFPVDPAYRDTFAAWVEYLRRDQLFGPGDALFPKPVLGLQDGAFAWSGLSRDPYANATRIREVVKATFTAAGFHPFGPHSLRKTLVLHANEVCKTPEQFKAWTMNLGHDDIATAMRAYMPVSRERQGELIRAMAR